MSRLPLLTLPLTLTLALALAAPAAQAIDDRSFLEGTALIQKAQAAGGESAVDAAADFWQKRAAAEPGDPLVRAYAGSALSMKATTTWQPWKKMAYAEDGLAQVDKALAQLGAAHDEQMVADTPVSLLVRFTAANMFLALPSLFNRGARGEDQLAAVLKHPRFAAAPLPFKGAVWLRAARLAQAQGKPAEARRLADLVTAAGAPQSAAAQELSKAL